MNGLSGTTVNWTTGTKEVHGKEVYQRLFKQHSWVELALCSVPPVTVRIYERQGERSTSPPPSSGAMGDIASLDQTLLSPRPFPHQLDLEGPCRPGPYQLKASSFVYGQYESEPLPSEPRPSPLCSVGANPTTRLTLPLGGTRWNRNVIASVARTLSNRSGLEKRQKGNNTIAQKVKQ